jgi:chitin synthase
MDRPTTPSGPPGYGRPPAYDDEDGTAGHMQGAATMRLLTNADDAPSFVS